VTGTRIVGPVVARRIHSGADADRPAEAWRATYLLCRSLAERVEAHR